MRHKRKGRRLGRSSSHRVALMRNLATALFLTERDEMAYEGLFQADGKTKVNPPTHKGRIVTTLQKAKEVKPLVEKCVTIACKAIPHEREAEKFATSAERNTSEWKTWRESENHQKWVAAMAPAVNARRRVFSMLRDKEAVSILFGDVAPRFEGRPGGYTRVMRLAKPRLGDNGTRAILEFVGKHDRVAAAPAPKPSFASDAAPAAATAAAAGATASAAAADDAPKADAQEETPKSPKGIAFDDLKVVEGIGPKCEEALKAAGIATWKELSESTPEKITEILTAAEGNFGGQVPTTWPEQASMAVAGEWDKLEKWQDELDGGKPVEKE